jgi:ankyrin repeat protein
MELGADVKSGFNGDPLHVAVRGGHVDLVKYFVKEMESDVGADVDRIDINGHSSLHVAAAHAHLDVVRLLVKLGAAVDREDRKGRSPLYIAAEKGNLNGCCDVIRCLVKEFCADVDQCDQNGCTPLLISASQGNLCVVRCLLRLKGDAHQTDDDGFTPLYHAVEQGHVLVVKRLLRELGDIDLSTPLIAAAIEGRVDMVQCLVKSGADLNYIDYVGDTPLIVAARGMHAELAKWLVKAGADPKCRHPAQGTAADVSRMVGASLEQTAYLEAKAHCSRPGCGGAGIKKCQGCMKGRYCGLACHIAHWPAHKAECRQMGAAIEVQRDLERKGDN